MIFSTNKKRKDHLMNTIKRISAAFLGLFMLTACSSKNSSESSSEAEVTASVQTTAPAEEDDTSKEENPPLSNDINPLTGELGYNGNAVGKRPVAVMVNNLKGALPQYGIEAADVIYEIPVEGGITRLMAVYADYTAVPSVCSVRSCRYYYPIICLGMDAIYCHWGSDQTIALDTLNRTGIDHLDGGGDLYGTLFLRDEDRLKKYASEHCGYLDGSKLAESIELKNFRTDLDEAHKDTMFPFSQEGVTPDTPANEVILNFSNAYYSTFSYDPDSGKYLKFHSGNEQIDQSTGNQLAFENVFILQTSIYTRSDGYLMNVELSGGSGYYASNGGIEEITWQKESESSPIDVFDMSGEELTVSAGKSYIGIIGSDKYISIT